LIINSISKFFQKKLSMKKYVKFEIPTNLKNLNVKIIFKTKAEGDSEETI